MDASRSHLPQRIEMEGGGREGTHMLISIKGSVSAVSAESSEFSTSSLMVV